MDAIRRGVVLVVVCVIGCGGGGGGEVPDSAPPADAPAETVTSTVDATGGVVTLPGGDASVTIPPGSVDSEVTITIEVSTDPAPAEALGPVYKFGPEGLVFAHPVTVTLAMPSGLTDGDVYWSKAGGAAGYDDVGGTVTSDTVTTQIVHFSEGFVGAAGTTRTVTGSQEVAWVSASTFQLVPTDLGAFAVAALVEDGGGGYTTITGVGHADGTFSIDDVPDGAYWLRVPNQFDGTSYYRTSANAVDAGYTAQGRPDAAPVAPGTLLQLDLTNLAAWQSTDQIEMFSSENYSWYFESQLFASAGVPGVSDTSLTGYTFDMSADYAGTPHRIDGSHTPPDRLVVAQLTSRTTSSSVPYQAMSRIFEPAPFTMTDGNTTVLSGAFSDVTTGQTLALDIRADAIRAALTEESRPCTVPASWPYGWTVYVLGVAGGLEHGITGATADLIALDLDPATPDVAGTDFAYGVPLQGTWGVYGDARFLRPCEYLPPGATTPVAIYSGAGLYVAEPIVNLGAGPLDVRLSQVRTPTIAGNSLFVENTGVGLTPTIAWTTPSVGTPTFYSVAVIRVYADGGGTGQFERVAKLITDQTSMTLPDGILLAGETYVFAVAAQKSSRPDPSAFNREALPEYAGTILSQMQHP